MTYNEYAQVLEAMNPDTGELYTPDDLNVVSYEDEGVGMLQDAIWADRHKLTATRPTTDRRSRSSTASLKGWVYCRDNAAGVPRHRPRSQSSTLGASHQLWQMNEINKLIWPSTERHRLHRPGGVGPHRRDRPGARKNLEGSDGAHQAADRRRTRTTSSTKRSEQLKTEGVDVNGASFARHCHPDCGWRLTELRLDRGRAGRVGGPPFSRCPVDALDLRRAVEHRLRCRPLCDDDTGPVTFLAVRMVLAGRCWRSSPRFGERPESNAASCRG